MDIVKSLKQISDNEKLQINRQVKADLINHLYQGCLPGTIAGIVASIVIFFDYYGYTSTDWLIVWLICFNSMMLILTSLYFFYLRFGHRLSLNFWETSYSIAMSGCAVVWIPIVILITRLVT